MRWTDAFLDAKRLVADPVADHVIDEIVKANGEQEARKLFDLLIRQLETPIEQLPSAARDYIQHLDQMPPQVDQEQIRLAHDLFLDHGPKMLLFLYFRSLPTLYSCANGAQVLFRTSRLVHDPVSMTAFTRRIAETAQFLMDVMTPGNLAPGATGIRSIQKVRLIHASVRKFIGSRDWDETKFGKPINQEDLAITLMTFSISLLDSLKKIKIREEQQKIDAFFHTWMGIGSLLGIDADLIPTSIEEGYVLHDRILQRQSQPSEAGKILTRALVKFSEETIPGKILDDTPEAMIFFLSGYEIATKVGLKRMPGCLSWLSPTIIQWVFRKAEKLEERSEKWKKRIDRMALRLTQGMLDYFNNYKGTNFCINDELKRHWQLPKKKT